MTDTDPKPPIALGADHGGLALKQHMARWLAERGHRVEDCGTFDNAPCDYPRIAAEVAARVSDGRCPRGILIDGAGIGSCMVANKFPGVRAALCYDLSSARNSREHNDANVLTLGASLIGTGLAEQIVDLWLATDCTAERHQRRVAMIGEIESSIMKPCACRAGRGESAPPAAPEAPADTAEKEIARLADLSPEDLDRIAARIVQMAGAGLFGGGGPCACCGSECRGHCAEKNPAAVRDFIAAGAGRIGHGLGGGPIAADVAGFIDHTLLKPEATAAQIEQLCREAVQYGFASVCINPCWVRLAASRLKGTPVRVCTVAGFPLGAHAPQVKALEARQAVREGASEIDMVINIGALKGGDDEAVFRDIKAVVDACVDGRAVCKVIIECALLTDEEKVRACRIARRARADFVKTSTGFSTGGATAADVALMSEAVRGARMGVKAAGGIRSLEDLKAMVAAGATRIGASAGVAIVKEAKGKSTPTAASATPPSGGGGKDRY
jgi:deoxyribose-phosphate aldolase